MIYNRTAQDYENAKIIRDTRVKTFDFLENPLTQAEIDTLERGMLTKSALNRIENKQAELKALLNAAGYWDTPITNKTWTGNDWCYREDWARIIHNASVLKQAYYSMLPVPPYALSYNNLNWLEYLLYQLSQTIDAMKNSYKRCGTIKCGGA